MNRHPFPKHSALSFPTPKCTTCPSSCDSEWLSWFLFSHSEFLSTICCLPPLAFSVFTFSLNASQTLEVKRKGVPGQTGSDNLVGESQRPFIPEPLGKEGGILVPGSQYPLCHLSCLRSPSLLITTLPPPLPVLPPRLPCSGSPVTAAQSSKAAGPQGELTTTQATGKSPTP